MLPLATSVANTSATAISHADAGEQLLGGMHAQPVAVEVEQGVGAHQRTRPLRVRERIAAAHSPASGSPRGTAQLAAGTVTGGSLVVELAVAQRAAAVGDRRGVRVVRDEQHAGAAARGRLDCSSPTISRLRAVSRFPVGSSARISRGSPASARAIATRWRSPPESSRGCVQPVAEPDTLEPGARALPALGACATPPSSSFSAAFSSAETRGIR